MAKDRKTRRFPLVLSMLTTVAATAAAAYYRSQLIERPGILDNTENMLEVPPELLYEVREGTARLAVSFENGRYVYELVRNVPVK